MPTKIQVDHSDNPRFQMVENLFKKKMNIPRHPHHLKELIDEFSNKLSLDRRLVAEYIKILVARAFEGINQVLDGEIRPVVDLSE